MENRPELIVSVVRDIGFAVCAVETMSARRIGALQSGKNGKMSEKDYYRSLGVSTEASAKEIKEAYRELAFQYHPDRNTGNPQAVEKMKGVNEAYAVLSNPQKKRAYDALRSQYGSSATGRFRQTYSQRDIFSGSDISSVLDELAKAFGFRGFDDIFKEFYGSGYRSFGSKGPVPGGKGFVFFGAFGLGDMSGVLGSMGKIPRILLQKIGGMQLPQNGVDIHDVITVAPDLARKGGPYAYFQRLQAKKLVVKIPPGIKEGQRIRLSGMGHPGKGGGDSGDLYLKVRYPRTLKQKVKELLGLKKAESER